jgi:hypothetical protein
VGIEPVSGCCGGFRSVWDAHTTNDPNTAIESANHQRDRIIEASY